MLDIDFPPTEEEKLSRKQDLEDRLAAVRSYRGEDAPLWFDTLPEVPEEDKPRNEKIIRSALDRVKIKYQRKRPSDN